MKSEIQRYAVALMGAAFGAWAFHGGHGGIACFVWWRTYVYATGDAPDLIENARREYRRTFQGSTLSKSGAASNMFVAIAAAAVLGLPTWFACEALAAVAGLFFPVDVGGWFGILAKAVALNAVYYMLKASWKAKRDLVFVKDPRVRFDALAADGSFVLAFLTGRDERAIYARGPCVPREDGSFGFEARWTDDGVAYKTLASSVCDRYGRVTLESKAGSESVRLKAFSIFDDERVTYDTEAINVDFAAAEERVTEASMGAKRTPGDDARGRGQRREVQGREGVGTPPNELARRARDIIASRAGNDRVSLRRVKVAIAKEMHPDVGPPEGRREREVAMRWANDTIEEIERRQ